MRRIGSYGSRVLARFETPGLTRSEERWLERATTVVVALFVIGWTYVVVYSLVYDVRPGALGRLTTSPVSPTAQPEAAFLLDLAVRMTATDEYRGESEAVRVVIPEPGDTALLADSLPAGVEVEERPATAPPGPGEPRGGGIMEVLLRLGDLVRPVPELRILRQVPLTEARGGRLGGYRIGEWPGRTTVGGVVYDPPKGLIRVMPADVDVPVSEHFVLGDFLTKGQEDVWPKYLALSPRLLDKLELTLQELERMGHPVQNVGMISGFRTPRYNVAGGDPSGRGALSRHMYGDAADIYIDNDADGRMDDLNGDGGVGVEDARVLAEAADRVESRYPHLIGGIGTYRPTGAHSGFVHIDTRGYRARW